MPRRICAASGSGGPEPGRSCRSGWKPAASSIRRPSCGALHGRRAELEESLRSRATAKLETLQAIQETLERARDNLGNAVDMTQEVLSARRAELDEAIEHVKNREAAIRARTARTYRASLRILRANPTAKARDFSEVLEACENWESIADCQRKKKRAGPCQDLRVFGEQNLLAAAFSPKKSRESRPRISVCSGSENRSTRRINRAYTTTLAMGPRMSETGSA